MIACERLLLKSAIQLILTNLLLCLYIFILFGGHRHLIFGKCGHSSNDTTDIFSVFNARFALTENTRMHRLSFRAYAK